MIMTVLEIPDTEAYKQASWLLKKMYQFDAAYNAEDLNRMQEIMKKVKKRNMSLHASPGIMNEKGSLTFYFQCALTHMKYDYKGFKNDYDYRSEKSNMDTASLVILDESPYKEFAYISLMLQGMTLEEAQTAYALGMEPVWQSTNPFSE